VVVGQSAEYHLVVTARGRVGPAPLWVINNRKTAEGYFDPDPVGGKSDVVFDVGSEPGVAGDVVTVAASYLGVSDGVDVTVHPPTLEPSAVGTGNRTTLKISPLQFPKGFDPKAGYIHFIDTQSGADVTIPWSELPDEGIAPGGIRIVEQYLEAAQGSSDASTLCAVVDVGLAVPIARYHVDVTPWAVADPAKPPPAQAKAHRMKEALAVTSLHFETAASAHPVAIIKSSSAPVITIDPIASSSLATVGDELRVPISGRVDDRMAGIVETSHLKTVTVFFAGVAVASLPLTAVADSTSIYAPYAKHFTFNGSVSIIPQHGDNGISLQTDLNEISQQGSAVIDIGVQVQVPNPVLTQAVALVLPRTFSTSDRDAITLTDRGSSPADGPLTITLQETTAESMVFADASATHAVRLTVPDAFSAADTDAIVASYTRDGAEVVSGPFNEDDLDSLRFARYTHYQLPLSAATSLRYTLDASGWNSAAANTITIQLPTQIAGSPSAWLPLTETGIGSLDFVGSFQDTSVEVRLGAAPTGPAVTGTVLLSDNETLQGTFMQASANPALYQASTVVTTGGGVYRATSVSLEQGRRPVDDAWEPYRIRFEAPAAIADDLIADHTFTFNGNEVTLAKESDGFYLVVDESGQPRVAVDPVTVPARTPGEDADPPPAPKGGITYTGDLDGVPLRYVAEAGNWAPDQAPPDTVKIAIDVLASEATSGAFELDWSASAEGAGTGDLKGDLDFPQPIRWLVGSYTGIILERQEEAAAVGNLLARANAAIDLSALRAEQIRALLKPSTPAWTYVDGPDGASGWAWNLDANGALPEEPQMWTMPPADLPGLRDKLAYSLYSAVDITCRGLTATEKPDPNARLLEKALVDQFTLLAAQGTIGYMTPSQAQPIFAFANTYVEVYTDEKSLPHGSTFHVGDLKAEFVDEYGILKIAEVITAYNAKNGAAYSVALRKWEEQRAVPEAVGWQFDASRAKSPAPYLQVLSLLGQITDPLTWVSYLGGGAGVQIPTEESATWAAVGWEGGTMIVCSLPIVGRVVGKVAKVLFKPIKRAVVGGVKGVDKLTGGALCAFLGGRICFVGDTPVRTPSGWRLIRDLHVGDLVLSRDPETGEIGSKRIIQTFTTSPQRLVHLRYRERAFEEGVSDGTFEIVGTANHPFWDATASQWVPMGELRPGTALFSSTGAQPVVSSLETEEVATSTVTYNLEVESWHTYFVGGSAGGAISSPIWVHNRSTLCAQALAEARKLFDAEGAALFRRKPYSDLPDWQKALIIRKNRFNRPISDIKTVIGATADDLKNSDILEGEIKITLEKAGLQNKPVVYRNGLPDFSPYKFTGKGPATVEIQLSRRSGDAGRSVDINEAWKEFRNRYRGMFGTDISKDEIRRIQQKFTWHHSEEIGKMMLVESEVHNAFKHVGGRDILDTLIEAGLR
jgi:hypothetical protein